MQDRDCRLLMNGKPQAGLIVGVTNPFFQTTSSNWPNVLTVQSEVSFVRKRQRSISKDRVLLAKMERLASAGRADGESKRRCS